MIISSVIAGIIAGGIYLLGQPLETSLIFGSVMFMLFSFNMAKAEIEELKLILDEEAPGWRERNADWTSTWDWNRTIKRYKRRYL